MSEAVSRRPFLTAEWRDLVIVNFEVAADRLQSLVPHGTELDLFEGRALASLVGFRFLRTRVLGVPIPWHVNFDEVNLRFYVRRRGPDGAWRRAVTFVRELVPRRAIATIARLCYDEPYIAVPMRHRISRDGDELLRRAEYDWKLEDRWHTIGASVHGAPDHPPQESEAAFTIEHYWGYTARRDGSTQEYAVAHPPWRVWAADDTILDVDARATYGDAWADLLEQPHTLTLIAEGSPVTVFMGQRLPTNG